MLLPRQRIEQRHQPAEPYRSRNDCELVRSSIRDLERPEVRKMFDPHDRSAPMTLEGQIADDRKNEASRIGDLAMMGRIDRARISFLYEIFRIAGRNQPRRMPPEGGAVRKNLVDKPTVNITEPSHAPSFYSLRPPGRRSA